MSHTPGPWQVHREVRDNRPLLAVCAKGRNLEWVDRIAEIDVMDTFRAESDARLIAAAPELLEACKQQHDALDSAMAMLIILTRDLYPDDPTKHFMPSQSPLFAAIKVGNAAVTKAEGR